MRFALLFILSLLLTMVAWAQTRVIQPGDKVMITVVEESSLTKEYTVTSDGLVLLNFLGAVKISGLTPDQAANTIRDQLVEHRILREATVKVELPGVVSKHVTILGATSKPGQHEFKEGMTIVDLLTLAPPNPDADVTAIRIQTGEDAPLNFDFSKFDAATGAGNHTLKAGDVVTIPVKVIEVKTFNVHVAGEVRNPGQYQIREGETISNAIEKAGGFADNADRTKVRLNRVGALSVELDLTNPNETALKESDIVEVPIKRATYNIVVEGAVQRPGVQQVQEGIKLTELLRLAGGMDANAVREKVLIKSGPDDKKPRVVDVEQILLGYSGDVIIRPGQSVFVTPGRKVNHGNVRLAAGAAVLLFLFGR